MTTAQRGIVMLIQAVPARIGSCRKLIRRLIWPLAVLVAVPALLAGVSAPAVGALSARQVPALPSYCQSGGSGLWQHLASCGWPGARNTGPNLANCPDHSLAPVGNGTTPIVLDKANQVVTCEKLLGPVNIRAKHVTITNSMVEPKRGQGALASAAVTIDFGASAIIDDVTIDGDHAVHACIWHQGLRMVVKALNCYGAHDGIFTWNPTNRTSTEGNDFSISNSYFHGFINPTANAHDDGYQTEGSDNGLVHHNTFRMTTNSTSAVAIWDSRANANDITVSDNLIAGGGFSVYAEDYSPRDSTPRDGFAVGGFSVTNIVFDDNSFSTILSGCVGKYGIWFTRPAWAPYFGGPTDGWNRVGNVVLETGQPVDNGNPYNSRQLCG